mmetsp:Transcript_2220/g.5220  ORF Transcript_2220/g.5220 Transcript_2220/m.5220 type:complete len:199 (+) Transcript_2220:266-862(+)
MFNYKMLLTPLLAYVVNSSDVDWKDPFYLWGVRGMFTLAVIFSIVSKVLVYTKVNATHDERRVRIKAQTKFGGIEEPARELSVTEHDMEQLSTQFKTLVISCVITVFLHLWNDWVLPMIMQTVHQVLTSYDHPLFQIHLLGYSDSGDSNPLKRPWNNAPQGFQDILKQAQMMDPKRREAAERKAEKKKAGKLNKQRVR